MILVVALGKGNNGWIPAEGDNLPLAINNRVVPAIWGRFSLTTWQKLTVNQVYYNINSSIDTVKCNVGIHLNPSAYETEIMFA